MIPHILPFWIKQKVFLIQLLYNDGLVCVKNSKMRIIQAYFGTGVIDILSMFEPLIEKHYVYEKHIPITFLMSGKNEKRVLESI